MFVHKFFVTNKVYNKFRITLPGLIPKYVYYVSTNLINI